MHTNAHKCAAIHLILFYIDRMNKRIPRFALIDWKSSKSSLGVIAWTCTRAPTVFHMHVNVVFRSHVREVYESLFIENVQRTTHDAVRNIIIS